MVNINDSKSAATLKEVEAFLLVMMLSGFTGSIQSPYLYASNFYLKWLSLIERLIVDGYDQDSVLENTLSCVKTCLSEVESHRGKEYVHIISFGGPFLKYSTDQFNSIAAFVLLMQEIVQEMKGKQTS